MTARPDPARARLAVSTNTPDPRYANNSQIRAWIAPGLKVAAKSLLMRDED